MDVYSSWILPNYFHGRLLKLAHLRPHYPLDIGYDLPESIAVNEQSTDISPSIITYKNAKETRRCKGVTDQNDGLWGLLTPPNTPPTRD